ncbi:uncharacterized protein LOC133854685 [Alnus glutinosa]|uniref:uncharacterized protein LOC133854685 n=1 Tax=Alnus glutinosa TaxID=3517 RepID=UPI002D773BB1|nr:uncharacterized protein LOC133854685 [Alnus glutinosa]
MNSLFSSFDVLFAEVLGQTVKASFFPSAPKAGQSTDSTATGGVKSQHDGVPKKAAENVNKKQQPRKKTPRFAPELDGLNCFETIVSSY